MIEFGCVGNASTCPSEAVGTELDSTLGVLVPLSCKPAYFVKFRPLMKSPASNTFIMPILKILSEIIREGKRKIDIRTGSRCILYFGTIDRTFSFDGKGTESE